MVVVFPTPLTPATKMTRGFTDGGSSAPLPSTASISSCRTRVSASISLTSCARGRSFASKVSVAFTPTSAVISTSSNSAKRAFASLSELHALCRRARSPCRVFPRLLNSVAGAVGVGDADRVSAAARTPTRRRRTTSNTRMTTTTTAPTTTYSISGLTGMVRSRKGGESRRRRSSMHRDGDDLGNSRLLHRHAVEHIGGLHGAFVVRDDDELGVLAHFAHETGKASDVCIVQWRVHLVEKTKRRRADEEKREDQTHRHQRFLAARQQRHRLEALARRPYDDLDTGLEQVVLVGQDQPGVRAAEEARKHRRKLFVNRREGFSKLRAGCPIEPLNRALEIGERALQIFLLCTQKLRARFQLAEFVNGGNIHFTDAR